ncbi:peptidase, S9A/B/C family, catalytic domain protein [Synechococcus sp. PCC 7335]|uniref:alpha/beta hydrolase family protein n=1 Tax=Synechococcus sp. (strain ATCC 29403 / PCC 7335) TaxID=91464 RepID=UPI00017EE3FE|nr:prolyl oligopeptidase family serine peptidase [Synechococcus sp. PCC 7335]EDX86353.1 peptidase, S9A/B/C family, catalytic domain protein [Synechococcus sp. PCC 7335]
MSDPAQATWQTPPEPIASMLDTPRLPAVSFSPDANWIVELRSAGLPPIEELAIPKLGLAGLQLNPQTWGPAKASYYCALSIRRRDEKTACPIALPSSPRIRNLSWSKCGQYLSFTQTHLSPELQTPGSQTPGLKNHGSHPAASGISLWVLELETAKVWALTDSILHNIGGGSPTRWLPDGTIICRIRIDSEPPPVPSAIPTGPVIEENLGKVAPARTFTNLLENVHDEALLEYYLTSSIAKISLTGEQTPLVDPDLYTGFSPSPDGQWLKIVKVKRPFSYQVPLARFPREASIVSLQADALKQTAYVISDLPLAEEIPINFDSVRAGRRTSGWRADKPATIYWVEALDDGDAQVESEYRDAVYTLSAPFIDTPHLLWKSTLRFSSLVWGNDTALLAYEVFYNTRQIRTWRLFPNDPQAAPVLLEERNFQDAYSSPGNPVTTPGHYGWPVLLMSEQGDIYFSGRGATAEGVSPFLDRFHLESQHRERIWRSPSGTFSRVQRILDPAAREFIVRRQTQTEPGNYWLHSENEQTALTRFSDPLPWYRNIHKEIVRYTRADGLDLSGTLYLPPNHDLERDGPLPTLLWVYPEEHKSRETASQVTQSENTFGRPTRASALFLLTQGYALLSGPSMPIVGEGQAEPNDTYLEQLIDSATAAVDYLVERKVCDRDQIAIGGHSYGAFTTANLLAHTDLFCAGIARSGAYNRSLTPFGFQGEQRNYWDATATYNRMSPFTNADKINHPLLLIHGAADNNSGTYPIQTERLYEAIKGLGGTVRYVSLPYEEHGYRSKEAIGHVLWEMVQWLDSYVKRI